MGEQPEGARQDPRHQRSSEGAREDLCQPSEVGQADDEAGDPQQRRRRDHDPRAAGQGAKPEPEGGLPAAPGDELKLDAAESVQRAHITCAPLSRGQPTLLAPQHPSSSPTLAEIWCKKLCF